MTSPTLQPVEILDDKQIATNQSFFRLNQMAGSIDGRPSSSTARLGTLSHPGPNERGKCHTGHCSRCHRT